MKTIILFFTKYFRNRIMRGNMRCLFLATCFLVALSFHSTAQVNIVHNFGKDNDLNSPYGDFVTDSTWLYGMTSGGGVFEYGTIFKIKTDGTGYTKLFDFDGINNGSSPYGSLTISGSKLYGMTEDGGTYDVGIIFKINTDGTGFTKLWEFNDTDSNSGSYPEGSLTLSGSTLYGMTNEGGPNNSGEGGGGDGTLFRIDTDGTNFIKLMDFGATYDTVSNNGRYPYGSLTLADTVLYGMTSEGGYNGAGVIFRVNIDGTHDTILLDFGYSVEGPTNGNYPYGSLTKTGSTLFGMTSGGGQNGYGEVFKIQTDGSNFTQLHSFNGETDAGYPEGSLTLSGETLYGMDGGSAGSAIFSVDTFGEVFNVLKYFNSPDGNTPYGSLTLIDTTLYGMTTEGGLASDGVAFSFTTTQDVYTKLMDMSSSLNGSGAGNQAQVVSDGVWLYGMTATGGTDGQGVLYKVKPNGTGYKKLLNFKADTTSGTSPLGSLTISGSTLYGMTNTGGYYGYGLIFKINTDSTGFVKLHSFSGLYGGQSPTGSLTVSGSLLYGMTSNGGNYMNGQIFKIGTDGSNYTTIYSFDGEISGGHPNGSITLSDSSLYGMVYQGGQSGFGLIFKIDTAGTNFTNLLDFDGGSLGAYPYGSLTVSADSLYGMTYQGGTNNNGIIFRINKDGTGFTNLLNLKDTTTGANPYGSLALSGSVLFGSTSMGGQFGDGTFFRMNTDGSGFTKLKDFNDSTGINPVGGITISNGIAFGINSLGGQGNGGSIFSYSLLSQISNQPVNKSVCSGTSTGFGANAVGTGLGYQWQVSTDAGISWNSISSAGINPVYANWNTDSLLLSGIQFVNNGYRYRCLINNETGWPDTSHVAILSVTTTPDTAGIIIGPPNVCAGSSSVVYTVAPITGATSYQWTLPSGFTGSSPTNTITIDISLAAASDYIKVAGVNGSCTGKDTSLLVTVNPLPSLTITNPAAVCSPLTVDLTAAAVTAGSTLYGGILSYWIDTFATVPLISPAAVTASGTYYIRVITLSGCSDTRPVTVTIHAKPSLIITNPVATCTPASIDITKGGVTAGSILYSGTLSYWSDTFATVSLVAPDAITTSGTYYIEATTLAGCTDVRPVAVTLNPKPSLIITNPSAVCSPASVDLTTAAITVGSTLYGGVLSYWIDTLVTTPLITPSTVSITGTYFIEAITLAGCTDIRPVIVTVNPKPSLIITNPSAVCSPATIDLTAAAITVGSTLYGGILSYWTDTFATTPLVSPNTVAISGTYYIEVTTLAGCTDIRPVLVTVNPKPSLVITNPAIVYSPTTVDITAGAVTAGSTLNGGTLSYWTDAGATAALATPALVAASGAYYIEVTTAAGCSDIQPVIVTVNPVPALLLSGFANEATEDGAIVTVTLNGEATFAAVLNPANWNITNLPVGVTAILNPTPIDNVTAQITLSGIRKADYDVNKNLQVSITGAEYTPSGGPAISANSGFTFFATNDVASLTITPGSANEGAEDNTVIEVIISGGTFRNILNPAMWNISNLPTGVTVGSVTQIDTTTAHITLSGNRTVVYPSDIILNLTVDTSQYDDHTLIPLALSPISGTFTLIAPVGKTDQTISFSALSAMTYGDTLFLNASSTSALPLQFTSTDTTIAKIIGNNAFIVGEGTDTIYANQPGDVNFNPAPAVYQLLVVTKATQVITFNALAPKTFGDAPFVLNASSTSLLPVSFAVSDTTIVKLAGNTLTIVGAGAVNITASQAGDVNYNAAIDVVQPLIVNKSPQTINFDPIAMKTYGDTAFHLLANSTSGLPVSFKINNTSLASLSGNLVTILSVGQDTIFAMQAGNSNYLSATSVPEILIVNQSAIIINQYNMIGYVISALSQDTVKHGSIRLFALEDSLHAHLIDSVTIGLDGSYKFIEPDSNYLVQVLPDTSFYQGLIPTYYGDQSIWSDASIIRPSVTLSPYNINCNGVAPLTGHGIIRGFVGNLLDSLKLAGRPMKGASVVLVGKSTKGDPIIAITYTDSLGNYQFTNIPDGTYTVIVNIAGISIVDPEEITLTPTTRLVDNISYAVTSKGVIPQDDLSSGIKQNSIDFLLYPNPAHDWLNIVFPNSGRKNIRIYQMDGKLIEMNQTDNAQMQINVSRYHAASYMLIITSGQDIYRRLFMKQ